MPPRVVDQLLQRLFIEERGERCKGRPLLVGHGLPARGDLVVVHAGRRGDLPEGLVFNEGRECAKLRLRVLGHPGPLAGQVLDFEPRGVDHVLDGLADAAGPAERDDEHLDAVGEPVELRGDRVGEGEAAQVLKLLAVLVR